MRPKGPVRVISAALTLLLIFGWLSTQQASADTWSGSVLLTTDRPSYAAHEGPGTLTATASVPVYGYLSIYNISSKQRIAYCAAGGGPVSQCSGTQAAKAAAGSSTYIAYVTSTFPGDGAFPTTGVLASSDLLTVEALGWQGSLTLTSEPSADFPYVAKLIASVTNLASPWQLSLYSSNGNRLITCGAGTTCTAQVYYPAEGSTATYTAYVSLDNPLVGPPVSRVNGWTTVTLSGRTQGRTTSEGIDTATLASLIDQLGPDAMNEYWLQFMAAGLGTHTVQSSVTDQQLAYEAELAAGRGTLSALKAATLAGGGVAASSLLWFLWTHSQTAPNPPAANTVPSTPSTTITPAAPILTFEDSLTGNFVERNPKLSVPAAQVAARTCIAQVSKAILAGVLTDRVNADGQASPDGDYPCRSMPVHLPGSSAPQTTKHDFEAITGHPEWITLNYVSTADRLASGLQREWYKPYCGTPDPNATTPQSCDEYPFYASAQSGPGANLKQLDTTDNSRGGSLYGVFARLCKLTSGGPSASRVAPAGTAFLVIPMNFTGAPPTSRVCQ